MNRGPSLHTTTTIGLGSNGPFTSCQPKSMGALRWYRCHGPIRPVVQTGTEVGERDETGTPPGLGDPFADLRLHLTRGFPFSLPAGNENHLGPRSDPYYTPHPRTDPEVLRPRRRRARSAALRKGSRAATGHAHAPVRALEYSAAYHSIDLSVKSANFVMVGGRLCWRRVRARVSGGRRGAESGPAWKVLLLGGGRRGPEEVHHRRPLLRGAPQPVPTAGRRGARGSRPPPLRGGQGRRALPACPRGSRSGCPSSPCRRQGPPPRAPRPLPGAPRHQAPFRGARRAAPRATVEPRPPPGGPRAPPRTSHFAQA